MNGYVGLFYFINDDIFPHTCNLLNAVQYGDFLTYPKSHDYIWRCDYYNKYFVDFDYYPRGRVVYNQKIKLFTVYIDKDLNKLKLITKIIQSFKIDEDIYKIDYDEHYQCHKCNKNYIK